MAHTKQLLITTLLCTCFITHTLSAFNFNIKELILGKSNCTYYGSEPSTKWYQEKAHEFLAYFGIKNVHNTQIYKLKLTANPEINQLPGITVRDGICFNEDLLDTSNEQERLWFVAHETAHFACNHIRTKYLILKIQKLCTVIQSSLCGAGFAWTLQHKNQIKKHPLLSGSIFGTCLTFHGAKTHVINTSTFFTLAKELEKEADLQAASMLCAHGLESVVLARIETLKNLINKGFRLINSFDHPSLEDNLAYLQEFWNAWTQQKA